jgi:hypothetical protein
MSDLLNSASLVMVPSGYKEDTVYSVVPSDGSGDLSFTRASNGTRINSAGLVEDVPWNLNTNSEDFATGWSGANRALTANATTAPNGTTTADQLGATGGTAYYAKYITSPVGAYTFSVFLKYGNRQYQQIYGYAGTAYFAEATFDLQNGTVYSIQHGNANIENVGGGWYRCSIYGTTTGVTIEMGIENIAVSTYTYAWGAQLNIGSTAKPYFPTTDRLNVPRLTYQNGGGGCPSLLLEKQSTNICLYSQDISNTSGSYWGDGSSGGTATLTANYAISPDGTQNATRVQLNQGSLYAVWQQVIGTTSGVSYTYSIWMKAVSGTPTIMWVYDGTANQNITLTNDWVRYTWTFTAGTVMIGRFGVWDNVWGTSSTADILAWGAQLEQSSYPTSYIPTTSSSATRVADVCSKTGISSLINSTEGVAFCDFVCNGFQNFGTIMSLNDGSTANYIWLTIFSNGDLRAELNITGSGVQCQLYYAPAVIGTRYKLAFGYKANDFVLYVNGALIGSDNSGNTFSAGTLSRMDFDLTSPSSYSLSPIEIKEAILFPTRLTNAELASLTTI